MAYSLSLTKKGYIASAASLMFFLVLLALNHDRSGHQTIRAAHLDNDMLKDIGNSTLGFQKMFIISLSSRTDRRDSNTLAAALTGLEFEFVDGVTDVSRDALPSVDPTYKFKDGALGSWRAHMNVAQRIVRDGLSSALVLEDDADWDIRIKDQRDFARASRILKQPLRDMTDSYLDPTHPRPNAGQHPPSFAISEEHPIRTPSISPYGDLDRWDVLWIGHCGARLPEEKRDTNAPLGRAVISNDSTVPEPQHINMRFGTTQLVDEYPAHTRVVSRSRDAVCTTAYAMSQIGARRVLYEYGVHMLNHGFDNIRSSFNNIELWDRRELSAALTISGTVNNNQAYSRNIRWSTKGNLEKLINGETDYTDLFKDGERPPPDVGL